MYVELQQRVEALFAQAIASGTITTAEVNELRTRLSYLAFNISERLHREGGIAEIFFAGWLFHIREAREPMKPHTEPEASPEEVAQTQRLLQQALGIGLLVQENGQTRFADDDLRNYFSLLYCRTLLRDEVTLSRLRWSPFEAIWKLWAEADPALVDTLLAIMIDGDTHEFRESAACTLGMIGNDAVITRIVDAAHATAPHIRFFAVVALAIIDDERAVSALIETLKDDDDEIREEAAFSLFYSENICVFEPMLAALHDSNAKVRSWAALALRDFRDARAVEPLIATLKDGDGHVRMQAAHALGAIGDTRAVVPVIESLGDAEAEVRTAAALTLGELGDKRAIAPLARFLVAADLETRFWVAWSLAILGDGRGFALLITALTPEKLRAKPKRNDFMPRRAAHALGVLGDIRAVEPLIAVLENPDSTLRGIAVHALELLGSPRALPALRALAQNDHVEMYQEYVQKGDMVSEVAARAISHIEAHAV